MQRTTPVQPPPDLGLLLLTITAESMRVIVRDLIVPIVALGITLATLHLPVPRTPRPIVPAPDVVSVPVPSPLEGLKVAELRQLARAAGHKSLARSGRRQQLLEVLA